MSLLPAFEIGVWNAWILTLYVALHPLIMILIDKLMGTGDIFKKMGEPNLNKTEKTINVFSNFVLLIALGLHPWGWTDRAWRIRQVTPGSG